MKQRIKSEFGRQGRKKHPGRAEKGKENFKKMRRNILNNMKHNNICIMGIPEEESEQRIEERNNDQKHS